MRYFEGTRIRTSWPIAYFGLTAVMRTRARSCGNGPKAEDDDAAGAPDGLSVGEKVRKR